MGKFSLENRIKDRLEGHEVHIDKRELWKSLGIEEEERDRKGVWLWWLGGLIGIAFISGLWWFVQKDRLELPNIQESSIIEVDENLAKTGNEKEDQISTSERLSDIIEDVKSQNSLSEKVLKESETKRQKSRTENRNNSSVSKFDNKSIRKTFVNDIKNSNSKVNDKVNDLNAGIEKIGDGGKVLGELIMIEELPQINVQQLSYERDQVSLEAEVNPLIKPIKKSRKFEFELYGSVGSINRELNASNGDFESYVVGRDTSESTLEHVSLGMSLKYIFGRGFYGKVGLGVNRWNEKYSYNLTSDTLETIIPIPEVILIDLQGNSTTTQFTEGTEISYTSIDWVRYNRLTQIDLPISLGYEHRINRWSIFGEATAILNVKQIFKGYLYVPDGELAKNPEIFKSNIGLNFGVNAGLGYGITPRLRARVSARYYRSLGSVLIMDDGIEQKYSSLGLRVGLGYLF